MPVTRAKKQRRRKLTEHLARIGRSEIKRKESLLELENRRLKAATSFDLRGDWLIYETSLHDAEVSSGQPIRKIVSRKVVENKRKFVVVNGKRRRRQTSVFDIGCGLGEVLTELKQIFGNEVRTVGLNLVSPKKLPGVDRMITGEFRTVNVNEKFDFILSFYGPTHATSFPLTSFEKILELLRPGGIAVLKMGPVDSKEIRTLLKVNGIGEKNWSWEKKFLVVKKPEKKRLP